MGTLRGSLIRPSSSLRPLAERVADGVIIVGSVLLSAARGNGPSSPNGMIVAAFAWGIYLVVAEAAGVYRDWRGARPHRRWGRAIVSWLITVAAILAGSAILGATSSPIAAAGSRTLITWAALIPALLAGYRAVMHGCLQALHRHGIHTRPCAIFGINDLGIEVARNLERAPELGLKLMGFYDDRPGERTATLPDDVGKRRGGLPQLLQDCKDGLVDVVYITLPMRAESRIQRDLLDQLADTTASVYIVPDFLVFELLHGRWTDIGGLPAVSVFETPIYGVDGLLKRVVDIVGASVALAIFALPMLAIAVAIKLTSRGPVFFRQRRYGLDGKEVYVWKFRSMTVCEDGPAVVQATKNDQRITPLGAILRKTSLDELPQLFNVLWGTMSLVGPRPHATAHNEQYRKLILGYMLRHKVKPGITGLAQVNGYRGETETLEKMQKRVEFDHEYIRNWSVWLDIKILFKTLLVVWSQPTAY